MFAPTLLLGLLPLLQGFALQPGQKAVVQPGQAVVVEPAQGSSGAARVQTRAGTGGAQELVLVAPPQQAQDRAWIGVTLATEQSDAPGLAVETVTDGSPAARAGLRPGDRLVALAGKRLGSYEDLVGLLAELRPGQEVALTLRRSLLVGLDRRGWGDDQGPRLGVSLSEQEGDRGSALVVTEVREGWPAAQAGLREGDRLIAANGQELGSFERLQDMLASVEPGHELRMVVQRRVELELGRFPAQAAQGFFFDQEPDTPQAPGTVPQPPSGRFRFLPTPVRPAPESQPRPAEMGALREELRALSQELRALREELSALRREMQELRRSRDR